MNPFIYNSNDVYIRVCLFYTYVVLFLCYKARMTILVLQLSNLVKNVIETAPLNLTFVKLFPFLFTFPGPTMHAGQTPMCVR